MSFAQPTDGDWASHTVSISAYAIDGSTYSFIFVPGGGYDETNYANLLNTQAQMDTLIAAVKSWIESAASSGNPSPTGWTYTIQQVWQDGELYS